MQNVTLLDNADLILIIQTLQAAPNLYTFLDEAISDELAAAELFDVSTWRITAKGRELLSGSKIRND